MGNLKVFTKRTRGEQDIQNALLRLACVSNPNPPRETREYLQSDLLPAESSASAGSSHKRLGDSMATLLRHRTPNSSPKGPFRAWTARLLYGTMKAEQFAKVSREWTHQTQVLARENLNSAPQLQPEAGCRREAGPGCSRHMPQPCHLHCHSSPCFTADWRRTELRRGMARTLSQFNVQTTGGRRYSQAIR